MKKILPVTRKQSIKIINELFEEHFGSDKGSGEAYVEWMERMGLAEFSEDDMTTVVNPPGQLEFLMALGVTPQELVDTLGINHRIFPKQFCALYRMKKPALKIKETHE